MYLACAGPWVQSPAKGNEERKGRGGRHRGGGDREEENEI